MSQENVERPDDLTVVLPDPRPLAGAVSPAGYWTVQC
jgi:hypothetical protein